MGQDKAIGGDKNKAQHNPYTTMKESEKSDSSSSYFEKEH